MAINHYPSIRGKGPGVVKFEMGVNLRDRYINMKIGEAVFLKDMYFRKDSLVRRDPLAQYSTEIWAGEGAFKGAHEYIDPNNNP